MHVIINSNEGVKDGVLGGVDAFHRSRDAITVRHDAIALKPNLTHFGFMICDL